MLNFTEDKDSDEDKEVGFVCYFHLMDIKDIVQEEEQVIVKKKSKQMKQQAIPVTFRNEDEEIEVNFVPEEDQQNREE